MIVRYISFLVLLFSFSFCFSQVEVIENDTLDVSDSIKSIPVDQVPIVSITTETKLQNLISRLPTDEQIDSLESASSKIDKRVSKLIEKLDTTVYKKLSILNFYALIIEVNEVKDSVQFVLNRLERVMEKLTAQINVVNKENYLWKNTQDALEPSLRSSFVAVNIDKTLQEIDTTQNRVLDRTQEVSILLRKVQNDFRKIGQRQTQYYTYLESQKKLVQADYSIRLENSLHDSWANKSLLTHIADQYFEFVRVLIEFWKKNIWVILGYLFFMGVLIYMFYNMSRKYSQEFKASDSVFKRSFGVIMQKPLSSAIIMGIYFESFFFDSIPQEISQIFFLTTSFLILGIVLNISSGKGRLFLYVFFFLVLLNVINNFLPDGSTADKVVKYFKACIEIVTLIAFYFFYRKKDTLNKGFNNVIKLILIAHIVASFIGLGALILGHNEIADIAINIALNNTLIGLITIIVAVALIGLIHVLVDQKNKFKPNFVKNRKEKIKKKTVRYVLLTSGLLWLYYILQMLHIESEVYAFVKGVLNESMSIGALSFSLGMILQFVFIIWLSVVISNLIKAILEEDVLSKMKFKKGIPRIISVVFRFCLITVGVLIAIGAIGMSLDQLTILLSAFGVGIGFGLQNIVNNFVSGIILLFERPIQIGDTVEINNSMLGTVKSLGFRSTNIVTFDGAEIIVPNANLISNEVTNWTLSDQKRRIEIISGVSYDSDVRKVHEILTEVIQTHPDVMKNPKPVVLFNEMAESSLNFRILIWTEDSDRWLIIKSEVVFMVFEALSDAGIKIPFPQRDLHIKSSEVDFGKGSKEDKK